MKRLSECEKGYRRYISALKGKYPKVIWGKGVLSAKEIKQIKAQTRKEIATYYGHS